MKNKLVSLVLLHSLFEATTLLKLCYYYAIHVTTIIFASSQILSKIVQCKTFLCHFSENASFFALISKVLLIISSQVLKKTQSDPTVMQTIIPVRNMTVFILLLLTVKNETKNYCHCFFVCLFVLLVFVLSQVFKQEKHESNSEIKFCVRQLIVICTSH